MTRVLSRRQLLLGGLPVCLLLLGFAGKVAVMDHANDAGRSSYRAGDYTSAGDAFGRNHTANLLERWVAPFNTGDASYQAGDLGGAVENFTTALETVPQPQECTVRINLAITQERQGDLALKVRDTTGARAAYEAAHAALVDGRCPVAAGQGAPQTRDARQLDDELLRKLAKLPKPADTPKPTPTQTPTPRPTQQSEQDKELQQNNEDGEQQRQDTEQFNNRPPDGPSGYHW